MKKKIFFVSGARIVQPELIEEGVAKVRFDPVLRVNAANICYILRRKCGV